MRRRWVSCEDFVMETKDSPVQVGHDVVSVAKLRFLRLPVVLNVLGKGEKHLLRKLPKKESNLAK